MPAQAARYVLRPTVPVTEAINVADKVRLALLSLDGWKGKRKTSHKFSGKDERGNALKGHQHSFYIPTDEDDDGILDHLTVYCRYEFAEREYNAMTALEGFRLNGHYLPVEMTGFGDVYERLSDIPLFGISNKWASATPFLLSRHPKRYRTGRPRRPRLLDSPVEIECGEVKKEEYGVFGESIQKDGTVHQLLKLINEMWGIAPTKIRKLTLTDDCLGTNGWKFRRLRKYPPAKGTPHGFEIELKEEIQGPLTAGYACHFGLGLFLPA